MLGPKHVVLKKSNMSQLEIKPALLALQVNILQSR